MPGAGKVLDVGCGVEGQMTKELRRLGVDAVGIDVVVVPDGQTGVPPSFLVQGDAADLPFPDGEFDSVVSVYSILSTNYSDGGSGLTSAALQEAIRVTKVGGTIRLAPMWRETVEALLGERAQDFQIETPRINAVVITKLR